MARKQKPVMISTGIATKEDIDDAIQVCKREGNSQIALLKCTSEYPAPFENINLKTIPDMEKTFGTVVGLSDHTLGITVPIAAVSAGAKIIEKHFILKRELGGPDASFSLEPQEFKEMVRAIRDTEKAMGRVTYELSEKTKKAREMARSLFVVKDIKKGEAFTGENVRSIRPGFGLHPRHLASLLGKKAIKDIKRGTPLSWDLVEEQKTKE
jgi:pseudaminic acid synthase